MNNSLLWQKQLIKIAEVLNTHNILWAVGASVLLYHHRLTESPNDIDIVVSVDDIEKVDQLLSKWGDKKIRQQSEIYKTDFFFEYFIDGIEIDIMAGFKIKSTSGIFEYKFDKESIQKSIVVEDTKIPLMTLEDWYVLYHLIPNKEEKVSILESYFKENPTQYASLLERNLENGILPDSVKDKIRVLL